MKKTLTYIFLFISLLCVGQKIDTIINKQIYKSYYSITLKVPVYVTYKIYQAGGDCSRVGFVFKNDTRIPTAMPKDYKASGYDEGHMADAADFSKICSEDESTFRFYNALPQTPNLNRGIWKHWETDIRKECQTDSILVICGGTFNDRIIGDGVHVPDKCWKVVKSLSTGSISHVLLFTNTINNAEVTTLTIDSLESILKYKIPLTY